MIYFAQAGEGGPVKIGYASYIPGRMADLQGANAEPLALIHWIDGDRAIERKLHAFFRPLRIRGEWFRFDPRMLTVTTEGIVEYMPPPTAGREWRLAKPHRVKIKPMRHDPVPRHPPEPPAAQPSTAVELTGALYARLKEEARVRGVSIEALACWMVADGLRPGKRPRRFDDPLHGAPITEPVVAALIAPVVPRNCSVSPPRPFKSGPLPMARRA